MLRVLSNYILNVCSWFPDFEPCYKIFSLNEASHKDTNFWNFGTMVFASSMISSYDQIRSFFSSFECLRSKLCSIYHYSMFSLFRFSVLFPAVKDFRWYSHRLINIWIAIHKTCKTHKTKSRYSLPPLQYVCSYNNNNTDTHNHLMQSSLFFGENLLFVNLASAWNVVAIRNVEISSCVCRTLCVYKSIATISIA